MVMQGDKKSISLRRKLLIVFVLVLLRQLYWIGHMVLFNNSDESLRLLLLTVWRFAPELTLILLGGMLLGPWWGAFAGVLSMVIDFVFRGIGLFSISAVWIFPASTLTRHVVIAVCVGLFIKKVSSYNQIMLAVFCSLVLGYLSEIFTEYFVHGHEYMLSLPVMLSVWTHLHGLGVFIHTLLAPGLYLLLKRKAGFLHAL